jgi:hypothetical protein
MRKLILVVSLLLLANTVLAVGPSNELQPGPRHELDRALHMILSPAHPLTEEERAQLLAAGVELQRPLTGGRYIARVVDATRLAGDTLVANVEPMTPAHKVLRSAMQAGAHGRAWADVTVLFHKDVSFDDARKAILAAGGALDEVFGTDFGAARRIDVRIAPASLNALASDDHVLAIGGQLPTRAIEDNATAALASHVPDVYAPPYNLSGAGQLVMVSELSDAQASHPEFGGRLIAAGNKEDGSHSTHVSGTIGAAGIRPDAKGMAPQVQIREFNVGSSITSHLKVLDAQLPLLHPVANNTSLGFPLGWCDQCDTSKPWWIDEDESYGAYDAVGTVVYDDITAKYGTLLVFSAGNDGAFPIFSDQYNAHIHSNSEGDPDETKTYCVSVTGSGTDCPAACNGGCEIGMHHPNTPWDTMTVTGSAKNVLAVGAVTTSTVPPSLASFSSRGPAKDGRVKPDVVARGRSLLSTLPGSTYGVSSGTSMSSPVVTGISALLGEEWQKTFGARPTVAELRGVILAGADDLGNAGPDYAYGFGLINAKASADLIVGDGGTRSQIANITVSQGTQVQRNVTVNATQKLRVLVTWPDPSVILLGNDSFESKALVNDLDLQVIGPDGTTYLPYVLDKVHYENPATRGVNSVDNTELVEIANAAPGTYRVIVRGTSVAEGPQTAVVVTNAKGVTLVPCTDIQEPNDSADTAWGNIPPSTLSGGICTAGDVDFFKFQATAFGPISATITSGDTPLRATLSLGNGQSASVDIPASSTRTVTLQYGTGSAQAPALNGTLKIEATGTLGVNPRYTATVSFGQFAGVRHRSTRH